MTHGALGIPTPALLPVGAWGTLFPRVGFVTHSSPPVASGLQAFRALNIAFATCDTPSRPRRRISPSVRLEGLTGCLQLAWPKQTPCILAGTPPIPPVAWDAGCN